MSFKTSMEKAARQQQPKHLQMIAAVEDHDKEEAIALYEIITAGTVTAEQASTIISEEMPTYTDNKNLHSISSRQIQRIRKGLVVSE